MSSDADRESESSLPTQHLHAFPSSPPVAPALRYSPLLVQADWSFENMDSKSHLKSEPPLTQNEEGAKPALRHFGSEDTDRPPSAQQVREETDEEQEEEELDSDPAEKITEFDWDELHERYHKAMQTCHDEEGTLAQEFDSLMAFFRIWAESGHGHETDRTYQRLHTRTTFVKHSEDKLENTRNHYINVVRAFESALKLLKAHGFGG